MIEELRKLISAWEEQAIQLGKNSRTYKDSARVDAESRLNQLAECVESLRDVLKKEAEWAPTKNHRRNDDG